MYVSSLNSRISHPNAILTSHLECLTYCVQNGAPDPFLKHASPNLSHVSKWQLHPSSQAQAQLLYPLWPLSFFSTHEHSENKSPWLCFKKYSECSHFSPSFSLSFVCTCRGPSPECLRQPPAGLPPLARPVQPLLSMAAALVHHVCPCSNPPIVSRLIQSRTQSPQKSLQGPACLPLPHTHRCRYLCDFGTLQLRHSSSNAPDPGIHRPDCALGVLRPPMANFSSPFSAGFLKFFF